MRLERLEISGFKSFPDRADLAFDRGVTAIVGPNGCGKSNVVDAITWVLGEQSAKSLRGDRMEDVIFSGSDARKPTGAAEVRLRLAGLRSQVVRRVADQVDGEAVEPADVAVVQPEQIELPEAEMRDVEVARRLYRSGESEYLIDGQVCRLRDVQDLLMDAGMGYKGYAVIEQGKIGQILSAKPADRRALIEEAAGVTKFKSRRRAAELKLEAAQQNLSRVDDVIFEVEKQRGTLKRQAAKARRYKKLRDELRRWEKVLFARRYRVLSQAIEVARARLAEAREKEQQAHARVQEQERTFASERRDLQQAEGRLASARERAHQLELATGRREQQIAFGRQQIETAVALVAELLSDRQTLEARRDPARQELVSREAAASAAAEEHRAARERLAAEEETFATITRDIEALEGEVESARGRLFAALNTKTTLRNVIERANEARERLGAELGRLDAELRDLDIEAARFNTDRDGAASLLSSVHGSIEATVTTRRTREAELTEARRNRETLAKELREREREVASVSARLRSLEEIEAGRQAYGEAARAILAKGRDLLQHHGSVADYLDTDRDHERAVEACLGDLLQAIVVDDAETAARGLELARQRNLGRCAFVVVDGTSRPALVAERPEGVEPVADVVKVSGAHAAAIAELLENCWIARDFDTARRAAQASWSTVATGDGSVFRGARLVTGGGRNDARSILATKREIKELRDRLSDEEAQLGRVSGEIGTIEQRIRELEAETIDLGQALHQHEKAAVAHELQVKRASEELVRIARKLDQIGTERRRNDDERRDLDERQSEAERQIGDLEREQGTLEQDFGNAQRKLLDARERSTAQATVVAEAKAHRAALAEREGALATEVRRLAENARELDARIAARLDEITRTEERQAAVSLEVAEAEKQLDVDRGSLADVRTLVAQEEQSVAGLRQRTLDAESRAADARAVLEDVRAAANQLEVARATAESDLAHLSTVCTDTLQMAIEDVATEVERQEREGAPVMAVADDVDDEIEVDDEVARELGEDVEALDATAALEDAHAGAAARALTAEEAIAELKAKIDRLGPVNMMAIEQFTELDSRHVFLTAQRKDLVDSIAQTGEAIKRIERTTRERFREAFTAINKYFEETFATLFGGGRAGLVLLDEDDVLESGIDIIAQPPGKRLQQVSLLSGGEKALTAMALMFAIFKYRPSPFCLLDEIDAPLDDANIGRFLEMLNGMLGHTQFIIITHSRKTMEMADRLYGVTMEEPGVSKLISLRLN